VSLSTLGVDAYQLTTLVAHALAGRLDQRLTMSFFFRRMPHARNYVVACGLRSLLGHAAQMRFDAAELALLERHAVIGPALQRFPAVLAALQALDGFEGEIDAVPEGTLAFAGPGRRTDGSPLVVEGEPIGLYTPLVQVRTDVLRAKLVETPWLSRLNHLSMVASKAARIVSAAAGKPVIEFGQRRTHPAAAIDASWAAWLAGCAATSNVAAEAVYGIPSRGTMDHFYVQAAERPGVPIHETEREAFAEFYEIFPDASTMLVDTYDTDDGLRDAVAATGGRVRGVRLDSNVTVESVRRARQILDELGATGAHIFVSDQLDEYRVRELQSLADAFGVGENITCAPDAATGIGCVGKVVVNGYGKPTMKLARGSRKATLPGRMQVWRYRDHDLVALADEATPSGGRALLQPVWRDRAALPQPGPDESRARVQAQIAALPAPLRALEPVRPEQAWPLVASDALVDMVERCFREDTLAPCEQREPA
jgi:nicotinate phosphoribosyltransferase